MFNISNTIQCFTGFMGWENSPDPCDKSINVGVTTTESGVVFNKYHPLLTFANIKAAAPNFDAFKFACWDIGTTYSVGDRVKLTVGNFECTFISLTDNNLGNQPDLFPLEWAEFSLLSDYLRDTTDHATQQLFHSIELNKKLRNKTKSIIENQFLYVGTGRANDTITNDGSFVGFEIILEKAENLLLLINQIGLQLTEVQPGLTIHLFHSSIKDAIATFNYVNGSTARTFQWEVTTFELPYVLEDLAENTTTQDSGGRFYIGYFQTDLVGEAINKDFNFSNCGGCGAWNIRTLNEVRTFLSIRSIKISAIDLNGIQLWDIAQTQFAGNRNWGINLKLTVSCDWSQFLCSNRSIFTNSIGFAVAARFLSEIAFNTRDNGLSQKVKNMAQFALEGDESVKGMAKKLEEEIEALNFDLSDFGSPCAPCEKRAGIRYKAA